MFLNLKVDYRCSLWPKRAYPTPWNIPSLSRTTCCACFSFTSLAFLLSLLVVYFRFHELLILECAKRKKKSLWTFSLSELFIQFHVFKYHPLAVKNNFSDQVFFHVCLCVCISIHLTSPCGCLRGIFKMSNVNLWTSQFLHSQSSVPLFSIMSVYRNAFLNSSSVQDPQSLH